MLRIPPHKKRQQAQHTKQSKKPHQEKKPVIISGFEGEVPAIFEIKSGDPLPP